MQAAIRIGFEDYRDGVHVWRLIQVIGGVKLGAKSSVTDDW